MYFFLLVVYLLSKFTVEVFVSEHRASMYLDFEIEDALLLPVGRCGKIADLPLKLIVAAIARIACGSMDRMHG